MRSTRAKDPEPDEGTSRFTCERPARPGLSPAKDTVAGWDPMVAVTGWLVGERGRAGADAPVATAGETAP